MSIIMCLVKITVKKKSKNDKYEQDISSFICWSSNICVGIYRVFMQDNYDCISEVIIQSEYAKVNS